MSESAPQHLPAPSAEHPRSVTILGATGSIGESSLDLIRRNRDAFRVEALTAATSADALAKSAIEVGAACAVVADESRYKDLKSALSGSGVEAMAGEAALIEAGARPADLVLAAIVGAAGLKPTLAAAHRGAVVALANKECLVCAGDFFLEDVKKAGAVLLPVDSEHNAIYQVFDFENPSAVEKIILTASGGPFRDWSANQMASVTPAQAVAHPNWDMGAKISVDSATMMNKGLELIEAYYLFPVEEQQIEIIVHPQSVIHSMVAYRDGSVLAQMGTADMRIPIAYALHWPDRANTPAQRLNFATQGSLTFEAPDDVRFPALRLAREALREGGLAPAIMNAANEVAVAAFLGGKTGFLNIAAMTEQILEKAAAEGHLAQPSGLDEVIAADVWARQATQDLV